jgi:ferric-dicitrate binding protein FerR (iron transport regulator)
MSAGVLTIYGSTKVDGLTAVSGQTLYSGSLIETSESAKTVVSLGARRRLELQMSSRLGLNFDDSSVTSALEAGAVRISAPAGVDTRVVTKGGVVISDRTLSTVFSVEFKDGRTAVTVLTGRVELRADGHTQQVEAGQVTDSANTGQPYSSGKKEFSGKKIAAIWLSIGGAIAIVAFIIANGGDDNNDSPEGCAQILSGMTDPKCF